MLHIKHHVDFDIIRNIWLELNGKNVNLQTFPLYVNKHTGEMSR